MTKRALFAILIPLAIVSTSLAADGKAYGKPLSASDTVKISALMSAPDTYVGRTVRVEGVITGVCEMRGCWMTLASDAPSDDLRIKVDDGVIVFPIEAKGKRAVAEGEFSKVEMTLEQTIAYRKHQADEKKKEFDPSTVKEPMTYYQIKATGAVIR